MLTRLTRRSLLAAGAATLAAPSIVSAQAWPARNVTLIVPFAAGGPTDVIARIMAQRMSRTLGQQVIVENVGGAGGAIGVVRAARAQPDGYTIVMGNIGTHAANMGLLRNRQYDSREDFAPISMGAITPMVLVTKKALPPNNMREFIAHVRANHQTLSFGTAGIGASSWLGAIMFHSMLSVNPTQIPYRGTGPALNDLVAGVLDYMFDQTVSVVPQIQGGTIKALGVGARTVLATLPDVPPINDTLPGYEVVGWNALFAPRRTPADIVQRLNAAARETLADDAVKTRLTELGGELPSNELMTPDGLGAFVRAEVDKWIPVVRASGAQLE
jgi:tripartite-type tricarboxylate transporter receptor subunit TctC